MNRVSPCVPIAALLAVERALGPQPDDVRSRVLRRARACVPRTLYPHRAVVSPVRPQRVAIGKMAAAAVVLSTLCSAAFYAGYRLGGPDELAPASMPAEAGVRVPAPSSRAAPATVVRSASVVPSCAPDASAAAFGPVPPTSAQRKAKPRAEGRSESDVYAMELRVLQPAQQAVARQDYAAALAAIAEHRRQFPSGKLTEEREALRVKALLGQGRSVEAERAGVEFRQRFPRSALRGRMDEMVETQK